MFEELRYAEWESREDPPDVDVDALRARYPWAREHFEDQPMDLAVLQASWLQRARELDAMPPPPERVYLEEDRPLYDRDPNTFTDAEAITRLIEVEAGIAASHALRARLLGWSPWSPPNARPARTGPTGGPARPAGRPAARVGPQLSPSPRLTGMGRSLRPGRPST